VIYAAAVLAEDDSPGRQSTEMMSHVHASKAYIWQGAKCGEACQANRKWDG